MNSREIEAGNILAELVGGAKDGDRLVVDQRSKVIRMPLGADYRRTGDAKSDPNGTMVHFFEVEP